MSFIASNLDMEQFDLDPTKNVFSYEKFLEFAEIINNDRIKLYNEFINNVNKNNVFVKLWGYIKNVFRWIGRAFNSVAKFTRRIFKKRKSNNTADSIAEQAGLQRKSVPSDNVVYSDGIVKSEKINIPKDNKSTMEVDDYIKIMYKNIKVKFDRDKETIIFSIREIYNPANYVNASVIGQQIPGKMVRDGGYIVNVMLLIFEDGLIDKLIKLSESIANKEFDNTIFDDKNWIPKRTVSVDLEFTMTQVEQAGIGINKIMKNLEAINIDEYNANGEVNDKLEYINKFAAICNNLQMAVNCITGIIAGVYTVDGEYKHSVGNITELSQFIELMIKDAFPSKYIAYNAYIVSSINLSGEEGDENNPIWGQTRLVFFPSDKKDSIYKIALSGAGITSNKIEFNTSERFSRIPKLHDLIAKTPYITNNGCIITAERLIIPDGGRYDGDISSLKSEIDKLCKENNIRFEISDVHSRNIGLKQNGSPCVIDYGFNKLI